MTRLFVFLTVLNAIVVFATVPSEASLITYNFNGVVTSKSPPSSSILPTVEVDSLFSGSFIIDLTTPLSVTNDEGTVADYLGAVVDMTIIFDSVQFDSDGTGNRITRIINDLSGFDAVDLDDIAGTVGGGSFFARLFLDANNITTFSDLSLVNANNMTLTTFTGTSLRLHDGTDGLFGVLTTLTKVPEPSTLALFATGLAGLGFMMRRRRSNETPRPRRA